VNRWDSRGVDFVLHLLGEDGLCKQHYHRRLLWACFEECIIEGLSGRSAGARLKLSVATGVRWLRQLRKQGVLRQIPKGCPKGTAGSRLPVHFWKTAFAG
jgi:hypothetical protein